MKKLKSWKTTAAALAIGATFFLQHIHVITPDVANSILTTLTAIGLASAKDNNVTGGTIQQ